MIKRILQLLAFVTGLCFIALLCIGSYSGWFGKAISIIPSPYRYGDLYYFSNTPGFRINTSKQPKIVLVKAISNTRLTLIGDSYLNGTSKENYRATTFDLIDWGTIPDTIPKIDRTKKNILVIETTERYARWRLKIKQLIAFGEKYIPLNKEEVKLSAEDNLHYLLTNFDFFLSFKEIKSYLYFHLFNRYDSRIARPNDSGRLFLNETIDENLFSSSHSYLLDLEIDEIVENLNRINDDALKMGYSAVYLSIIPNATSIYNYNGKKYNHLIERIQAHPELKIQVIDTYQLFMNRTENVFHVSDSHWNSFGQQLWLNKVNEALEK